MISAERHPNVVSALIAAHADLKANSKEGFTAIHFAARVGDLESVKLLLAAGVDVNLQTQTADGDAAGASARTYQHIMGADPVKDTETDR